LPQADPAVFCFGAVPFARRIRSQEARPWKRMIAATALEARFPASRLDARREPLAVICGDDRKLRVRFGI
jgi:hypothetical protein